MRTRLLVFLAAHFGSGLRARPRCSVPKADPRMTPTRTPLTGWRPTSAFTSEVLRGLAARGRERLSGTFRAAVFGANDGLVSNLALVLGIGATGVDAQTILFTGLAGLLGGGAVDGCRRVRLGAVAARAAAIDSARPGIAVGTAAS